MNIQKHGNKYRISQMKDGKRYYVSVDHKPTKKEAEQIIFDYILNHNIVTQMNHESTFSDAVNDYCSIKSRVLSPSTLLNYKRVRNNLPDYFQLAPLHSIDNRLIQRCINDYAVNRSPKTVQNAYGLISAVMRQYTDLNVKANLPMKIKKEPYIPTPEEVKALIAQAKDTKYYVPIMLAVYGLRRSEIYALTIDDLEGNVLTINKAAIRSEGSKSLVIKQTTKTASSTRKIYISDDLAAVIRSQGYVTKGSPDSIFHFIDKTEKELGIPHFSLHKLRHYFATQMSAILPEADVLALGGWSTPNVMKTVYRHNQISRDQAMQKQASDALMSKLTEG